MSGRFHQAFSTDAKRACRAWVYGMAAREVTDPKDYVTGKPRPTSVLMIAGRAAHEEIACARATIPGCDVTAVDIDPVAVECARLAGADDAVCMNMGHDRWSDYGPLPHRRVYDFVNLSAGRPNSGVWTASIKTYVPLGATTETGAPDGSGGRMTEPGARGALAKGPTG